MLNGLNLAHLRIRLTHPPHNSNDIRAFGAPAGCGGVFLPRSRVGGAARADLLSAQVAGGGVAVEPGQRRCFSSPRTFHRADSYFDGVAVPSRSGRVPRENPGGGVAGMDVRGVLDGAAFMRNGFSFRRTCGVGNEQRLESIWFSPWFGFFWRRCSSCAARGDGCESPCGKKTFERANNPGGDEGSLRPEDFSHDQAVAGNAVENFAVESVKQPNGANGDPGQSLDCRRHGTSS